MRNLKNFSVSEVELQSVKDLRPEKTRRPTAPATGQSTPNTRTRTAKDPEHASPNSQCPKEPTAERRPPSGGDGRGD